MNPDYDPNKIFKSHTWERFARGKTLVGVDEADTLFSTAEKTGGEKEHTLSVAEMPAHNGHFILDMGSSSSGAQNGKYLPSGSMSTYGNAARGWYSPSPGEWVPYTIPQGHNVPHNNLQPYVTVYYWKRIA